MYQELISRFSLLFLVLAMIGLLIPLLRAQGREKERERTKKAAVRDAPPGR